MALWDAFVDRVQRISIGHVAKTMASSRLVNNSNVECAHMPHLYKTPGPDLVHYDIQHNAIENAVKIFRTSLPSLNERGQLTAGTPSHGGPPPIGVKFTFEDDEVHVALEKNEKFLFVHHRAIKSMGQLRSIKLLDEHLTLFASRHRGTVSLRREIISNILTGQIRDWQQIGYGAGPIHVLAHGGPINKAVLDAFARHTLGIDIKIPIGFLPDYAQLAKASNLRDDTIVFGLRPAYVDFHFLSPVIIDGVCSWESGEGCDCA